MDAFAVANKIIFKHSYLLLHAKGLGRHGVQAKLKRIRVILGESRRVWDVSPQSTRDLCIIVEIQRDISEAVFQPLADISINAQFTTRPATEATRFRI